MIRIKVCGITRVEDALAALAAGADSIGLVFWRPSPRAVEPARAREIVRAIEGRAEAVGVFVDEEPGEVDRVVRGCGLDLAQLHGNEDEAYARRLSSAWYPAFRVRGPEVEAEVRRRAPRRFLLDASRAGETFDWALARRLRDVGELHLAGGLSPANVAEALSAVLPAGVDVSSSLETGPGVKDHDQIRSFVEEVRQWERRRREAGSAGASAASSSPRR